MAVAMQPSAETKKPAALGLIGASVAGAAFILAAAAVVLRILPWLWETSIGKSITDASNPFMSGAILIALQVAAAVGLLYVATHLRKGQQSPGARARVFFMLLAALLAFFSVSLLIQRAGQAMTFVNIVVMLFSVVVLFLVIQFFRTGRFRKWSVAVDEGGWFDTHNYKKTQGLRVRRLTILGILLLTGTGIWTLMNHNYLPTNSEVKLPNGKVESNHLGDWVVGGTTLEPLKTPEAPRASDSDEERARKEAEQQRVREENRSRPRVEGGFVLLPDLNLTVPLLLIAASIWIAWRIVNNPQFADFLIATEAEINKVSWSTRKQLIRDTLVVLVSLVLITIFLFVVDVFWGWFLSRGIVGVLPGKDEVGSQSTKQVQVTDW